MKSKLFNLTETDRLELLYSITRTNPHDFIVLNKEQILDMYNHIYYHSEIGRKMKELFCRKPFSSLKVGEKFIDPGHILIKTRETSAENEHGNLSYMYNEDIDRPVIPVEFLKTNNEEEQDGNS